MNNDILDKLKKLQEVYVKNLPNKLIEIETQWRDLSIEFGKQKLSDFHRTVHTLCGSSGTYGYIELSKSARHLEVYLKQLLNVDSLLANQKSEISHLVENLKDQVFAIREVAVISTEVSVKNFNSRLIYYLNNNESFEKELQGNLAQLGYQLVVLKEFVEFQKLAEQEVPGAIVVDANHLEPSQINYLANYHQHLKTPLLCVAELSDLPTRLKAIRAGVSIFLQKPVDVSYLTKLLDQICGFTVNENYRILILDDSTSLAKYYQLVLTEAGMTAHAITNPMNLLNELGEFSPDLLLMDLYMPGCTGLELAAILRQSERYASLPIIFISTEDDKFKQLAALSSGGGDDFLTKPVLPEYLVSAVKSRARRSALLHSYITRDSLTELLNHTYILQQLESEVLRAQRHGGCFSFVMVDLDHFKNINDQYGHPGGDKVLRKVSEFLLTRLRKSDFVGRYGGEEFAAILPNTTLEEAVRLCDAIREKISLIEFIEGDKKFHVNISMGIAAYPQNETAEKLTLAADTALYKAKTNGRNRVEA